MSLNRTQIMTEAMKLDALEREALAEEILLSIRDADREQIDAAWLMEARRRDAAFEARQTTAKPVDEVIQRLLNKGQV